MTLAPEASHCRTTVSRPKDIVIVGLALSSGALALLSWRQQREIRQLESGTVAAMNRPAVTLHGATQRSFTVASRGAIRDTTDAGRPGIDPGENWAPSPADPRGAPARARRGSTLTRLMDNPEFLQALGVQRHAMLDARFAALFRQLNLGEEELAAFKRLLAEKENVVLDVVTVSETSADGPLSPEVLRTSVRAAQAQVEQAIHSSLGSERYAIYRDYERTVAQRATVAQLEQRLSYTAAPLTAAQSDAVVRILAANAPITAAETPPVMSVVVRAGVPEAVPIPPTTAATGRVTDEVITQAQSVLAPAQVSALVQIQAEQQASAKAAALIREAIPVGENVPGWGLMLLQQ